LADQASMAVWRQRTRVAVAILAAALALTAPGQSASTGTAGAQPPAWSGPSRSLPSGNATITGKDMLDDSLASAQPPVNDPAAVACAGTPSAPGHVDIGQAAVRVVGWADVSKLGGSQPLGYPVSGAALSAGGTAAEGLYEDGDIIGSDGAQYLCSVALLHLDYDGQREFPPVTATFLVYGFIPVTATAYLVQDGPAPLETINYQQIATSAGVNDEATTNSFIVTTAQVSLRVAQVKVNGVPLDVGGDCQTTEPVYTLDPVLDPGNNTLVVSGGSAPGEPEPRVDSLSFGGMQAGLATVPPFAGCVTPSGENLDPLLDSSLSGAGNYVSVYQGNLCTSGGMIAGCQGPPDYLPVSPPFWTVSHAGPYSATAPLTITQAAALRGPGTVITCPAAAVTGDTVNSAGPPRGPLGTFRWAGTLDCTDAEGNSWTVTQQGTATLEVVTYDADTQTTTGTVDDVTLEVVGPGGCTDTMTGALSMTYANGTGALTLLPAGPGVGGGSVLQDASSSTCSQLRPLGPANTRTPQASASYALGPGVVVTSP
jgi:hypothetical protein